MRTRQHLFIRCSFKNARKQVRTRAGFFTGTALNPLERSQPCQQDREQASCQRLPPGKLQSKQLGLSESDRPTDWPHR